MGKGSRLSSQHSVMKIPYFVFAVVGSWLLATPGLAADVNSEAECKEANGFCREFYCITGSTKIGKCGKTVCCKSNISL
ncbi:gallinacin-8-like isoform X2 [Anolis carolinensis]|uniref:gallinacin-8-like isoform X2 n=1 Tax=Anolis carolinensis TaxID=28377 RepID=UPI002F2B1882